MKKTCIVFLSALLFLGLCNGAQALDAPSLVHTLSGTQVAISWSSVSGATGYTLYYAPSTPNGYGNIESIDMGLTLGVSFSLWDRAAYYFAVQAYNGQGQGLLSEIKSFVLPAFSAEILADKTFYDIYKNNNQDGFLGYAMTFNPDGSLTYAVDSVTDLTSASLQTGGTWSLDDNGVLFVVTGGTSSHYKLLNTTNPNGYQVCWRRTHDEAAVCNESSEYFVSDRTVAQNYINTMSPKFSMDWLNGKTLHKVYFGIGSTPEGSLAYDIASVTKLEFSNGEVTLTNVMNSDVLYFGGANQVTTNYTVTAHGNLDILGGENKPVCVGPYFIKSQWVEDGEQSDSADMWFFDENEAINYANSLTEGIPLECSDSAIATSSSSIVRGTFGSFFRSLNTTSYGYLVLEDPTTTAPVEKVEAFEVRPGDCESDSGWSDCENDRERSELSEADKDTLPGDMHWYGWNIYFPEDYPNIYPTKTALGQFHQLDAHPVWMFQHSDSGYYLDDQVFGTTREYHKLIDESDLRGQWHNIELQVLWATDGSGYFRVWVDGVQKVDYSGQTMDAEKVYFKYGIYRSFMSRYKDANNVTEVPRQKVYYSNVKRSNTREGLQP